MAKNNIEEIVLEYISGKFDTNRQRELEEILIQNGYTMDEVKELSKMYNHMDDIPVPEPS